MASVLIVDDAPDSCEVVKRYFQKAGYSVRCVPNGQQALTALGTSLPDVVLLDLRMPQMDGVSFLQIIRNYLRWASLPVVLLTAYPDSAEVDRARQFGVQHVFAKANYNLVDLLNCVNQLVRSQSSGDSLPAS